jgi:uncharacterized protein (DUF433 family)
MPRKAKQPQPFDWRSRISIRADTCFGKPRIKGTRIWVSLILDLLASGTSQEEILGQYPHLTHDDIRAALAYGAEAARERFIPVPMDMSHEVQA